MVSRPPIYTKMADSETAAVTAPIIMKVDEPPEDSTKQDNVTRETADENVFDIKPSSICSPSEPKSVNTSNQFTKHFDSAKCLSKSVLRPSQLCSNKDTNSIVKTAAFMLNPSKLNPFAKVPSDDNTNSCDNNEKEKHKMHRRDVNGDTPKFVPLLNVDGKTDTGSVNFGTVATVSNCSISQPNTFVFGQNIRDRVVSVNNIDTASASCTNANGSSDMLFTTALKENTASESHLGDKRETKSLSESAREYEESRTVKRKYEEVEVKTGEEEETNVLQISCKLFAFDTSGGGSWQERGRGILRLNDKEVHEYRIQSRLVFRTSGSLRVILNTKIWANMTIQQASTKSIRLTAFDRNGDIKIFLITGSPDEMKQLYKHLEIRVKRELSKHQKCNTEDTQENSSPKKIATDSQDH